MNTHFILSGCLGGRYAACVAAIVMALLVLMPVMSIADQSAATKTDSSAEEVSFSDLNLSTPEGMRVVRDRLHTMAERLCGEPWRPWRGGELSSQPGFGACVDRTVANALRRIDAVRRTGRTPDSSLTLGASVSLTDLDLSTPEGARIARQRLAAMVRRLCGELERQLYLSFPPNYDVCIRDGLAGALAQADALTAAKNTRTAGERAR